MPLNKTPEEQTVIRPAPEIPVDAKIRSGVIFQQGKIIGTVLDEADANQLQGQCGVVPNFQPTRKK